MDHKKISFLITHYNRPKQLLNCINAIKSINYPNFEIVVSDDSSKQEVIETIKTYDVNTLVIAETNKGLGANINRGLRACKGEFIIYCQEDFLLKASIKKVLPEVLNLISNDKLDMVRFISSYNFKKLKKISINVSLIPKFSLKNFLFQSQQYSDNPFITTIKFYEKNGYYLEGTSGDYGETEYAIRIFKSKAKIGITNQSYVSYAANNNSVIDRKKNKERIQVRKKNKRFVRAIRLHLEALLYRKSHRRLITYKNLR